MKIKNIIEGPFDSKIVKPIKKAVSTTAATTRAGKRAFDRDVKDFKAGFRGDDQRFDTAEEVSVMIDKLSPLEKKKLIDIIKRKNLAF